MLGAGIVEACIKEAKKSEYRFKMGAVIFKGNRIIGKGYNAIRSCSSIDPKYRRFNNALHCELRALLSVKNWKNLKGADMLVIKISKTTGSLSNAKPCYHCQCALQSVGIRNVYFTDVNGTISMIKAKDLNLTIDDLTPLHE